MSFFIFIAIVIIIIFIIINIPKTNDNIKAGNEILYDNTLSDILKIDNNILSDTLDDTVSYVKTISDGNEAKALQDDVNSYIDTIKDDDIRADDDDVVEVDVILYEINDGSIKDSVMDIVNTIDITDGKTFIDTLQDLITEPFIGKKNHFVKESLSTKNNQPLSSIEKQKLLQIAKNIAYIMARMVNYHSSTLINDKSISGEVISLLNKLPYIDIEKNSFYTPIINSLSNILKNIEISIGNDERMSITRGIIESMYRLHSTAIIKIGDIFDPNTRNKYMEMTSNIMATLQTVYNNLIIFINKNPLIKNHDFTSILKHIQNIIRLTFLTLQYIISKTYDKNTIQLIQNEIKINLENSNNIDNFDNKSRLVSYMRLYSTAISKYKPNITKNILTKNLQKNIYKIKIEITKILQLIKQKIKSIIETNYSDNSDIIINTQTLLKTFYDSNYQYNIQLRDETMNIIEYTMNVIKNNKSDVESIINLLFNTTNDIKNDISINYPAV
jgi:hypothetical protein